MAITKIYKGTAELTDVLKIYKGSELVYEKEVEPSYPPNVVVFKSAGGVPRTITPRYTRSGITLQYSVNRGLTWTNIYSGETTASSDEIWFRGRAKYSKALFTKYDTDNAWGFSAGTKLHVYGDLRYLLCDNLGDDTITFNIDSYCFCCMFYNCTDLATAPELPATRLADSCYSHMFRNCTRLTTAPSLPATTLANNCYQSMFEDCKSLTTAPSLPATALAIRCYTSMFMDCTSLTTVPNLPATTLAESCYEFMFRKCTAFKVSETKTGSYQYPWRIPTSGTGTTAAWWNYDMLWGTGGPYTSNPVINTTYYVENPPV